MSWHGALDTAALFLVPVAIHVGENSIVKERV